ncbi:fused response regulator/phosphatase [Alteromonas sp. ASW11-19]|uniref:Fused response regulator/phosphatase n=1 Tax=Alteromonas salexigens TaxID=2982530 RepID=A0ABT2VSJ8_9ALTE|nr:fused response regulator/phosphatase [Alteromonas salexigens]MCU7555206.1 fused response regulator/phosphatase [Alteromonas salexigens]
MRILVVDDESINRTLLVNMLEQEGYRDCMSAESGEQALRLAKENPPDLVLLDVMMPGLNGYEVAPKLKMMAEGGYLPVIFITSLDDKRSIIRCLEVGGDDFMLKPFDRHILAAKIRAHDRIRTLSKRIDEQNQQLRVHQQKVEREHAIVEHIFGNAIVNKPEIQAYFDVVVAPATDFNGDVFLCERSPKGGLYFLLGDFTGHGLASAIGALPVTRAFQTMSSKGLAVSEMAFTLNQTLYSLLPADMFFAASIVEISESGKRFTIWNGGLPALVLKNRSGRQIRRFVSRHMALGVLQEHEFDSHCDVFEAEEGDQLMAYSDGIIEITDNQGNQLNEEGVAAWFTQAPDVSAHTLYSQARDYLQGRAPDDDMTLAIYRCQSLDGLRHSANVSALPFAISCTLSAEDLKADNVVAPMLEMVNSQQGLGRLRSDLFTVLTEMLSNAVEHGLLELDSTLKNSPDGFVKYYALRESRLAELQDGEVQISIAFCPQQQTLSLCVDDTGNGFEVDAVRKNQQDDAYGRGLLLIDALCDRVWHENNGRKTCAVLTV